ncbi:cyclophilin-like fold protein [Streptomyces albidoflavus]|uniref:cyclophilin-like fold protein n=1 Tax=Streptomyces albidoflavus TaxID=1886 RepID=UPI0033C095EE
MRVARPSCPGPASRRPRTRACPQSPVRCPRCPVRALGTPGGSSRTGRTWAFAPPARDFAKLLPLTLELEDFHDTERVAALPRRLDTSGGRGGSRLRGGRGVRGTVGARGPGRQQRRCRQGAGEAPSRPHPGRGSA